MAASAAVLQSEAEIRVRPINGFIGAEIEGVDLRGVSKLTNLPRPKPRSEGQGPRAAG